MQSKGRYLAAQVLAMIEREGGMLDAATLTRVAQTQSIARGNYFDSTWLRAQMKSGAQIMSICNGAKVLAHAGAASRIAVGTAVVGGMVARRTPGRASRTS